MHRTAGDAPSQWRVRGMSALLSLRAVAFIALDAACLLIPVQRRRASLTLRLDAVGDFFIWLQSGAADVAAYARLDGRHSILLANRSWAAYAAQLGLWDDVISIDPSAFVRNPFYRLRMLWRLRRRGAERLIQPRAARVFLQEDEIARISGATACIGNAGTRVNSHTLLQRIGDRAYSRLITVSTAKDIHETVRNEQFAEGLTGKPITNLDLSQWHATRSDGVVVVALGAGEAGRIWPTTKFAELLRVLHAQRPALSIRLLGAPADRELAREFLRLVDMPVTNRTGETTLQEFVDDIARSSLVICNDSSAFHIAMAFGKRVVCFLGGGHFGWFAPYPSGPNARVLNVAMPCYWCNWQCVFPLATGGAFLCVESIPVAAAIAAIGSLFENT